MGYDEKLAERIRTELKGRRIVEKKMFGGVGYMINGNMACGVHKDELIVRVDPEAGERYLKREHVRPFGMSPSPMKGWLLVSPPAFKTAKQLSTWVRTGLAFARKLPPK